MTDDVLSGRTVAFLVAAEGIEQVELTEPWKAVQEAGAVEQTRQLVVRGPVGEVQLCLLGSRPRGAFRCQPLLALQFHAATLGDVAEVDAEPTPSEREDPCFGPARDRGEEDLYRHG